MQTATNYMAFKMYCKDYQRVIKNEGQKCSSSRSPLNFFLSFWLLVEKGRKRYPGQKGQVTWEGRMFPGTDRQKEYLLMFFGESTHLYAFKM